MRTLICHLIIYISFSSYAQSNWTAAFPIKTTFEKGEMQIYEVSELFKIDNIFIGLRSKVKSNVSFNVIDTANGGYWIRYTVSTNSVKQHKDSSAYLIANLMDGIKLYVFLKNGYLHLDSASYFKTKKRINAELDSIAAIQTFAGKYMQSILYLQTELKKEAGLGIMLSPLMIFEVYYSSEVYKKFRISTEGKTEDILNKPLFSGIVEREWQSTSKDSLVKLNYHFTGDPIPAAKYYRSVYEPILVKNNVKIRKHLFPPEMRYLTDYTFHTRRNSSFPMRLFQKNVSEFIFRSVNKIEMKGLLQ